MCLVNSFLSGRRQRSKIGTAFSKWADIFLGVPQGSILGPLLFNIYINDIFFFTEETSITNYADDNTPYVCDKTVELISSHLENDSLKLCHWFKHNYLKCNEDKCHLLLSKKSPDLCLQVGNETIYNSAQVKLLGITFENELNFDVHVSGLCKKANSKSHALSRVAKHMGQDKLRLVMKAFITSQFGYWPLVWTFHSRSLNNRINKIHEKSLRLVYKDNKSTFSELLDKDNSVTRHDRNLQALAIEVYKSINDLSPVILKYIFDVKSIPYNLRSASILCTRNVKTVKYGSDSLSFRGAKIWALVPDSIKISKSLSEFKSKIRKWRPAGYNCKIFIINIVLFNMLL